VKKILIAFISFLVIGCGIKKLKNYTYQTEKSRIINISSYEVEVDKKFVPPDIIIILIDNYNQLPWEIIEETDTLFSCGLYIKFSKETNIIKLIILPLKKIEKCNLSYAFVLGHEIGHYIINNKKDSVIIDKMIMRFLKKCEKEELSSISPEFLEECIADEFGYYFEEKFPNLIRARKKDL